MGWDQLLGEDVPARPRLCSLQSSESDPDSPPFPEPALDPHALQIPSGIICRTRGMDVLGRAGTALGIRRVLPTVLGCSRSFCKVLGTSVPWQGREEPTHPKSVNPWCEGRG